MFTPLSRPTPLKSGSQITKRRRRARAAGRVALSEPAERVMTDFALESPVTIAMDNIGDDVLLMMSEAGVDALFAMRGEVVVGVITSHEILADRASEFLMGSGLTGRSEVEVSRVMTPWAAVPTIDVPWLALATVADVRERFRRKGTSHFVVVEYAEDGSVIIRGMFSRTEVERRLE